MVLGTGLFSREESSRRGSDKSITGSPERNDTEEEITHYAILVPGTGPHREDEKPKGMFMKKAQKFRSMLKDTCKREFASANACVEMEPIEFHADMHALESANPRMDTVTLPSIPWIRTLDNEVIGDILYYFASFHGHRMLEIVICKLNDAYRGFMERHPRFTGQINLIAHSLGGLICYEIMYLMDQRKKHETDGGIGGVWEASRYKGLPDLAFSPNRLFTMGSPLGGTMVFRNLSFDEYLMGGVGYHNIFHPYDPFGYRTEPLVDDSYADTPAVPITSSPDMHGPESLSEERDGSSVAQDGGPYHYRRAPHRQSTSLGGYVTDIGRTVVDAMVIAPITISSTMLRVAKSTVSAPVNAMARRMSNSTGSAIVDEESADSQRPRKLRHRMSMLLGVSSSSKQDVAVGGRDQLPSAMTATRKSFSWIVPSRSSQSSLDSGNKHHQRRKSLSRLLYHSRHRSGDKSPGSTLRPSEAGSSIRQASVSNSSDTQLSSESKRTAQEEGDRSNVVASPTPLSDDNAEECSSSSSSEQQYQCSPLVAAAVGAMATSGTAQQGGADSDTKSDRRSTSSLLERYSIATSGSLAPQQSRRSYDASYDSVAVDTDDMVGHIMRIFSLSRPPGKRQQLAEAQGLPLSSHLLSSSHCHYGVPISTSLTIPYNNGGSTIAPGCSSSSDIVHKHGKKQQHHRLVPQKPPTKGGPLLHSGHSGASEACSTESSGSERMLTAGVRRSNTLPLALADGRRRLRASSSAKQKPPHRGSHATETRESPPQFQKAHTTIGSNTSSSQADDGTTSSSSVSAEEKEATIDRQNAAEDGKQKQLPYPERMDYIIPFTKRHLQNEYWLGFQSHFSYWTSKEVVYHILYHMVSKPMPQEEANALQN